ncbi:MAG: ECF transporter S component, partial [Clostridiales bacterium]|nr:ECF transporter S component [Clostridiales bacterium]
MNQTKKLVLSALFAALICVATFTIRIPIVATNGYIHLGDALVILAGIFLSPASAFLAAGIGSCLADLFGGYIIYVPATFFIKGIIAFLGSILFHKMIAKSHSKQIAILLCGVV